MISRNASPRLLALAGTVVLWASAFPAIRVGLDGLGPAGLSFLRPAVAAAALVAVAPVAGVRLPRARDLPLVCVCGLTGVTGYQALLNWGEVEVPAGTASLLIAAAPVFSVLWGAVALGERPTGKVALGTGVSLAGTAVVTLTGGATGFTSAAFLVLAAAFAQGTYHVATKPLLRHRTGLEVATYAMVAGTVLALPLAPSAVAAGAHAPAGALLSLAWLGLLPSALGFVIWGYAVARLPLAASTGALYLVPPVALLVSFVWLGEVPRPAALAGGAVTVLGVVLLGTRDRPGRPDGRSARDAPPAGSRPDGRPRDPDGTA